MDLIYCDDKGRLSIVYFAYRFAYISQNDGIYKTYSYETAIKRLNKMHFIGRL